MALNYIWLFFFAAAFISALGQLIFTGNTEVFDALVQSTFSASKTAFEISLGLTGVLTFWLGLMKVGEAGGVVQWLSRAIQPFFRRLFPEIPADHPAFGSMLMNLSANLLGLDNAATPFGLKAMRELQTINPDKDTASNAQILFLVLNTSGLTLIPLNILMYRAQLGAADPTDVFLPILFATSCSTLAGFLAVAWYQKISLKDPILLAWIVGLGACLAGLLGIFTQLSAEHVRVISTATANVLLFTVIISFLCVACYKRINVYETFIEGAKEGFTIAVSIIPYLVAILVAIAVFRASGALDFFLDVIRQLCLFLGLHTQFVDALPTALMKPLSGTGSRALMIDAMTTHGADSFVGRLACIFQGSTDTTLYILAVYFGSVAIRKTRHALTCGLIADAAGIITAIFIATLFFG